ncbi:MAG: ATP-binding protein, partial [Alphaproteobacteria bacterium]
CSSDLDAARQGLNEIRRMRTGRLIEMQRTVTPDGGFVSLYRDVTEHRRSMNELAEARRIAEDAAARKSEILAIVGHEIRTPMTGIVGFLQLLEGTTLTIEQRTYLGIAATSSQALLGLLDDLLVHSRGEAGMLATQLDDCDLHAILRDAAALFGPVAARKSVHLDWQVADDVAVMARTDPGRLRQIVNNLTANGVKFTQSGDVLVRAETIPVPEGRIAAIGERWLRITVADRGPGVPDAEKQRIFEPYVQGSAAGTGDQMVGTGLGLAICRRLVALLDGTIGVADRPGGGAVFWVEVPILPATAGPVVEAVSSDPLDEPGRRILVVEDDPVNQYLAKRFVEHLGHRIEIAGSGSDALARLSEGGFDVVLMDRQLPDADGIDVVRRLRSGPRGRDLAVVVVTASVDDSSKRLAIEAGAEELLVKPYRLVGLRAAIDRAVRKRRAA